MCGHEHTEDSITVQNALMTDELYDLCLMIDQMLWSPQADGLTVTNFGHVIAHYVSRKGTLRVLTKYPYSVCHHINLKELKSQNKKNSTNQPPSVIDIENNCTYTSVTLEEPDMQYFEIVVSILKYPILNRAWIVHTSKDPNWEISEIKVSPNNRWLLILIRCGKTNLRKLQLFELSTGTPVLTFKATREWYGHEILYDFVFFSEDEKHLAMVYEESVKIILLELQSQRLTTINSDAEWSTYWLEVKPPFIIKYFNDFGLEITKYD